MSLAEALPAIKCEGQNAPRAGRSTGRTRKPAEVWPVGHFVENEMRERRWTKRELLSLMGGSPQRELEIELLLFAPTKGVILDSELAADLARVFGTSAGLWINLDKAWQDNERGGKHSE